MRAVIILSETCHACTKLTLLSRPAERRPCDGASASSPRSPDVDAALLRRLGELGFIAGEPLQVLRRGPGGREPLAVLIGETMFALRLLEAQCIEVRPA